MSLPQEGSPTLMTVKYRRLLLEKTEPETTSPKGEMRPFGPSSLTLVERMVGSLHLPYPWACLLIALVASPTSNLPFQILDTGSLAKGYAMMLSSTSLSTDPDPLPKLLLYSGVFIAVVFFFTYYLIYIRLRLLRSERDIEPILQRRESFSGAFASIGSTWKPLIILLIFIPVIFASPVFSSISSSLGPTARIEFALVYILVLLIIADFLWVYGRSLWGLHQLGERDIRLRSYLEDGMLGARPLGSLSLSIALGYFGAFGLLILLFGLSPIPAFRSPIQLAATGVLVIFGVLLFVLPLNSVHRKMSTEKRQAQAATLAQYRDLLGSMGDLEKDAGADDDRSVSKRIIRLERIEMFEISERRVAAIPTWPFDTAILSRLTIILLSVAATLLAAGLRDFLRF